MNIRPKIPIYQGGNTLDLDKWIQENQKYYDWYSKLYPNAQILQGSPLKQRNDNWDKNKLSSSHYTTDDLRRSAYNNYLYTQDYDARQRDLIYWSEQQKGLDKLTDQQLVDLYNKQAQTIRDAREAPQTYNTTGYSGTNQTFRNMFYNRSKQGTNTPAYTIGYQENLDNIEGTSTWQRRMDRYENPFEKDTQEGQQNRTFYINIPGTDRQVKVYKKENGDLGLFPNSPNTPPSQTPQKQTGTSFNSTEKLDPKNDFWQRLSAGFNKIAPDLLAAVRYAGNMHNNERVYNEMKQAIIPNLQGTYTTHRRIVGDEATKQAYYRRAAQGESKAAKAFTSDADRQMAYMMEAKRIGDELRTEGDLADNQEIRRTSDESNQHQWANIQRANEIATANITELNKAKAAKHQLAAQKYSADWTNTDEYLLGWQNKFQQKQAKQQALQDQVDLLTMQDAIYDDPTYKKAYENLQAVVKKHTDSFGTIDSSNPEVIEAQRALRKAKNNYYLINYYSVKAAKSGMKITKKDTSDKFLYKTSRDIVEHFRKMSKMTDDSRIRTIPKPAKLSSHPRKIQLGGVVPFTVYRPLGAAGGETTTQTSTGTDSKSSKDDPAKNKLDMIKEMFKAVQNTGLPIDVNVIYKDLNNLMQKAKLFGEELSTDDIASIYLQSMQKINNLKYSKENYDKAMAIATSNEALNEYAVDASGNYVVQDKEGNLSIAKSLSEIAEKGLNPITNQQLLNLRAYSPNMAFQRGDALVSNIINNGMGINKIGAQIRALADSLGSIEGKLEGISQVESGKVKNGLQLLAGAEGAPDGHYSVTNYTKDQQNQIQAALKYIENMLSPSQKAILEVHGGTKQNIALFLASQQNYINEQTISPLTGKAAKNANGNSKEDSEGLKLDAATALISGEGYQGAIEFNPGTSYAVTVNARHSGFQKKSGENMGSGITMQEATTSTLDKVLDWNKATLGGSRLNPTGYNRIMINNDDVVGVDLPVGSDKNTPDFTMLQKLQVLDQELLKRGIEDIPNNWKQINQVCQEIGLPAKYKNDNSLNEYSWNRFAAFQVTADDSVLVDKNAILSDILGVVEDDNVREQYEQIIQKDNKNYKLGSGFLGLGKQALYQGTVFVPINSSYVASALSGGQNISMQQATNLELRERGYDQQKIATYKPGININEL